MENIIPQDSQYTQEDENEYRLKYQANASPTNITTGTTGYAPDNSDIVEDSQDNSAGDSIEIVHQDDLIVSKDQILKQ